MTPRLCWIIIYEFEDNSHTFLMAFFDQAEFAAASAASDDITLKYLHHFSRSSVWTRSAEKFFFGFFRFSLRQKHFPELYGSFLPRRAIMFMRHFSTFLFICLSWAMQVEILCTKNYHSRISVKQRTNRKSEGRIQLNALYWEWMKQYLPICSYWLAAIFRVERSFPRSN